MINHDAKRGFASDNNSGIDSDILKAITKSNHGHVIAYGDDEYTIEARKVIKDFFGENAEAFFVLTGTGANTLAITAVTQQFNAIICAETAHINVDECGAPEKSSGCKLLTVDTTDGKLTPALVKKHLTGFGFEHHVQPAIISISQPTEMGTVYTVDEIKNLSSLAKQFGLYRISDSLTFCRISHFSFPVFNKGNNGWSCSLSFTVWYNNWFVTFHYCNA